MFGPLKTKWSEICHQFFQKNPGKVITKFNFNKLFSEAWLKSLIPANIIAGFRKCGVYPYNPAAISIQEAGVTVSREVSTVGEIGESSPCNEDGVSHEAAPTCGPDGGVTPSSDPDGETSPSCGEASFRGVHAVSQSGATNELSWMNNWNFLRNA